MLGIKMNREDDILIIRWQLTKIEIPVTAITEVTLDDTYGGSDKDAMRIGTPYGTTGRVLIRTKQRAYLLFTSDAEVIKEKTEQLLKTGS
ncbi:MULTISPECIES: PH domain-containing protein [unclassified Paenibacillus]|uniref:SunI/YnzG family protein n=1 Tax=unclassified Paenibacillus TaxID=185978 RepID=UPI002404F2B4|nr:MULTISPECIES: PH domain-containing protein [unclassified Paenibacillus]MDF9839889.1 hypothetical protein [Paenibacillus sp. PastF-2]MDF9846471.1 hypothetical protein [Paenibacillus sp. PastM-2]MDF9853181.1 hypothetical protein [Paenibacillus sp. PastF-1]MDH6478315.1 hypothetical protein [Paenibacillus sp. PastH-2]MDH6506187.1 hypothetical protein [Paenibacillus sp. PastM-3]